MSQISNKTYDVLCKRQDNWYRLERVTDFQAALKMAKEAIENKKNEEVRILESIYDANTKKEKTSVSKIFTQSTGDDTADLAAAEKAAAKYRSDQRKKKAEEINKRINNLAIALVLIIVLIIVGGLFFNWLKSYWGF